MCVLIFTILAISCASANSYHLQSATYEDFPNKCSDEISMSQFVRVGEKYYLIEATEKLSWFGAVHFCRSKNANLADIQTADEMHAISKYLVPRGYTALQGFWISGNDLTAEGKFASITTGKPMAYTKWHAGEPNNGAGHENCVHLAQHGAEYYMNDWQCGGKNHYICEANTPKTVAITFW